MSESVAMSTKIVRRNTSDKLKLIQMVHCNPILWDSRLPNFKGAEEEKSRAWQLIGNEFGVPGRRVARAFKSLRESYRRELALVKTMGEGFQPKWGLFAAMDFLRDVIRERKSTTNVLESLGLNKSGNNSNLKISNISSLSSANDDYSFFVESKMNRDANPDNRISSTLNGNYDDIDDNTSDDSNQVHHHNRQQQNNLANGTTDNEVEELEAIDADFPYPLIIDNSPPSPSSKKLKRRNSSSDDETGAYDETPVKLQPTVREVLNSKFCGFITAKLNSMEDSEADNLMNRILLLLVQTQNNTYGSDMK